MLYYEQFGEKSPTLIFLHGYFENLKIWYDLTDELSKIYRIVLIDLPGHGQSQNLSTTNTMDMMAEKVIEVIDHLDIDQFSVCGHSMGGYISLALAEKYPDRIESLVLMNSTTLPDNDEKKAQRLKAVDSAQKYFDTLVNMSIPNLFAKDQLENLRDEIDFVKTIAKETSVEGVQAALRGMRLRPDRTTILNQFSKPKFIILGSQDEAVNPTEFLSVIQKDDQTKILELNMGHMAYLEAYDEVLEGLNDFFGEVYVKKFDE